MSALVSLISHAQVHIPETAIVSNIDQIKTYKSKKASSKKIAKLYIVEDTPFNDPDDEVYADIVIKPTLKTNLEKKVDALNKSKNSNNANDKDQVTNEDKISKYLFKPFHPASLPNQFKQAGFLSVATITKNKYIIKRKFDSTFFALSNFVILNYNYKVKKLLYNITSEIPVRGYSVYLTNTKTSIPPPV